MIETAVFSWKHKSSYISLWQVFLWCGSINWAKKCFKKVILISDNKGIDLLFNKLELPFDETIELPFLPDELSHVYDLPKLSANIIMAERNIPCVHIDYDAWLRKKLPDNLLNADFFCEYLYDTRDFVKSIHDQFTVKRFNDKIPEKSCATGIYGGNDLQSILQYSRESLKVGIHQSNREFLKETNGYQTSVIIGEVAPSKTFAGRMEFILPRGPNRPEDHANAGHIHLGRLKKDHGIMAKMAIRLQLDFPNEYIKIAKLFNEIEYFTSI